MCTTLFCSCTKTKSFNSVLFIYLFARVYLLEHLTLDCLLLSTEHIETMMQLLTAVVKKFPLIVPDKSKWALHSVGFAYKPTPYIKQTEKPILWVLLNCLILCLAEDSHPFCASSVEQYYSWNIGKRRASEVSFSVL